MENYFETEVIEALKKIHDEEDIDQKNSGINTIIKNIDTYMNYIYKGHYRSRDYGEIFTHYFRYFTVSIVFGETKRNNGSGCLLRLNKDLLITNAHVIKAALKTDRVLVGKVEIYEIKKKVLDIDEDLDLAVIDLSDGLNEELEDTNKMFFEPKIWPPLKPEREDLVYIVGFPGVFREDEETFTSVHYAAIHENIVDVTDRRMISQFTRENWKNVLGPKDVEDLTRLGGLSGGPVFMNRDGQADLVGFTFEDGGSLFDGVKIIRSHHINKEGEIIKNPTIEI